MSVADSLLLLAGPTLQGWLLIVLVRRRVYARFLWFCIYTTFAIVAGIVEFTVRHNAWKYTYVYWAAEALYAILGFFAIQEAFRWVFQHFYIFWWFKLLLPAVGVIMLAIAVIEGYFHPPIQAPPVLAMIFVAEIAVRCLQGGIFILFVLLIRFFALPGQSYAMGISLGFGISALGSFLMYFVRSTFGTKLVPVIKYGSAMAYLIAVVVWLIVFRKAEPPDPYEGIVSPLRPEQDLELMRNYTRQMKDLFKRCLVPFS